MSRRRLRKRMMAEINIVPYIDVMLVLLVIFMVTAPLLNQGVEVDLPQAQAETLPPSEQQPLVLTVDREGSYYLNLAEEPDSPLSSEDLFARVVAVLRRNPDLPVLVRGDRGVDYGLVVEAMALLQQAGADQVGLSTRPSGG
ncbi:MAG: protein TolR [Candidatus Competibacteraceae bacterium]|nr:protein TolR [Candidatus Competibacteraceae bacterium]